MRRKILYFDAPRKVSVSEEELPIPASDQVSVQSLVSAVSAGTEMLFYRGQVPAGMPIDETIPSLNTELRYPLKYGYAAVGRVIALGKDVSRQWEGRVVFAFNPHESHFLASPNDLVNIPESLSPEDLVFLPNMETAVNLVMDGQPLIGEQAAVFGQGVVGLLTTALLARMPLVKLVTLDRYPIRRHKSISLGAQVSLDPAAPDAETRLHELFQTGGSYQGADLVYELSGDVRALDQALAAAGPNGRVVIGSWYGSKKAELDLGGHFHRSRIALIASQVSTIAPRWRGRWTKTRRLLAALKMIEKIKPASLITHRYPIDQADQAKGLIDQNPQEAIQVILTYEN